MKLSVTVPDHLVDLLDLVGGIHGLARSEAAQQAFLMGLRQLVAEAEAAAKAGRVDDCPMRDIAELGDDDLEPCYTDTGEPGISPESRGPCRFCGGKRFGYHGLEVVCLDCRENEGQEYRQSPRG